MASVTVLTLIILQIANSFNTVQSAQQQLKLSDSYLPVAMQVIAHLTDQMAYEVRDEPIKPTARPQKPAADETEKPATWTTKPTKPSFTWSTQKPTYVQNKPQGNPWHVGYIWRIDQTTPFHRPGLFAPVAPPLPGERVHKDTFLLPPNQHQPYTVIAPHEKQTHDTFLNPENHQFKPLVDPKPDKEHLLPPNFDNSKLSRTSENAEEFFIGDEMVSDEELQYLSPDLKDILKLAHDYNDERLIEDFEEVRKGDDKKVYPKGKPSASNLRLMLLYDLLSRDAKKQRLNDFSGFSNSVMQELAESSSGGARNQLRFALSRMLDRHDCSHDYANNRAREMIQELAKDESTMSNEIRYLQPLVYRL